MRRSAAFAVVFTAAAALAAPAAARTWHVVLDGSGDLPTLQAAIDTAVAGDTVLVGPGTWSWSNQGTGDEKGFIRFLERSEGFTVRGETGPDSTVLDAEGRSRVVYLHGMNNITFEGFTVRGGDAGDWGDRCGGGFFTHIAADTLRDCVFEDNLAEFGGGFSCSVSRGVLIENCVFRENESTRHGGGIAFGLSNASSVVRGCLVTGNVAPDGAGILSYYSTVTVEECVVAGNAATAGGGGILVFGEGACDVLRSTVCDNRAPAGDGIEVRDVSILRCERSIVAFNRGDGIAAVPGTDVTVGCCCVGENDAGDALPPHAADAGGNLFLDPLFCGRPAGNYLLRSDSPCLPVNNPNGIFCQTIGALPRGCDATAVRREGWGGIKRRLR